MNKKFKLGRKKSKIIKNTIIYILMAIFLFIYVVPLWYIISTSFKLDVDAYQIPPKFFFTPTFKNYIDAFTMRGIMDNFRNSVTIALVSSVIAIILGVPAAYALSRFKFKGKSGIYGWILSTRMAPAVAAAIPFFTVSRSMGIYDTIPLMVTIHVLINLAWVIWMMSSNFNDIPKSLDEAAMVDGCTRPGAFWHVIIPISRAGLVATLVFTLIMSWNEYFFALVLTSTNAKTLPAAITSFQSVQGLLLGQMCAVGTVVMLPILIFSMSMQRQLIHGMTMGAVKG